MCYTTTRSSWMSVLILCSLNCVESDDLACREGIFETVNKGTVSSYLVKTNSGSFSNCPNFLMFHFVCCLTCECMLTQGRKNVSNIRGPNLTRRHHGWRRARIFV